MNPNPLSEPYYLLHFLTFFSYLITRTSATSLLSPHLIHRLVYREIQAVLAFALLAAFKGFFYFYFYFVQQQIVRDETWEAFISNMLFFAKLWKRHDLGRVTVDLYYVMIFLVAISLIMDYHLALWYMVVFSVIYLVTQPPAFEKLGMSSRLTPLQLETLLTEGNTSRFWLVNFALDEAEKAFHGDEYVEFRALCSSACIHASRCFPELSVTYSNKNLSFGIVDLGLFPNAAEKFGISLSGGMNQLPTYILFENATEVTRFPEWDYEAKASHPPVTKRVLSRHFELDRHLLEYVNGK
ncbi:hypothetical protein DKX38_010528 [Salix brachista]|uniref:Thioredoxin domain-containing protein n=1 Tax=Salix brachista TaxID=2182728 RepID=A0A5N5MDS8_9ROSI|nr:hypothetical protein DKX38_010528 [Salix brachista]